MKCPENYSTSPTFTQHRINPAVPFFRSLKQRFIQDKPRLVRLRKPGPAVVPQHLLPITYELLEYIGPKPFAVIYLVQKDKSFYTEVSEFQLTNHYLIAERR